MKDDQNRAFTPNVGARIRNLLNGAKLTTSHFSELFKIPIEEIDDIVREKVPPSAKFLKIIEKHPIFNLRDLYDPSVQDQFPVKDDTLDGVLVMTKEASLASDRQTLRGPSSANKELFYSYRDTAMSRLSLFRPERLAQHYLNPGNDPKIPEWAYNKGHFEHQMTYFIGPVNFHWKDAKDNMHVQKMDTGDTNYITPFTPHTFSTREKGKGTILAVTYGGAIATEEYRRKIQKISSDEFVKSALRNLPALPDSLATDTLGGVMVKKYNQSTPKDGFRELMGSVPFQPASKILKYQLSSTSKKIKKSVETWGYNIGKETVFLSWAKHSKELSPEDSFIIRPNVAYSLSGPGQILVVEISPEKGNPTEELSLINRYSGKRGLARAHTETTQWF